MSADITKRLRIKADMINLGERIAWGSDTAIMHEAADELDARQATIDEQRRTIEALMIGMPDDGTTPVIRRIAALERERDALRAERDALRKALESSCAEERAQLLEACPGGGCSRALTAEQERDALHTRLDALEKQEPVAWKWAGVLIRAEDSHPLHRNNGSPLYASTVPASVPECAQCANRGRVDGLSEETHCEHCVHQEPWRTDHFSPKQAEGGA